MFYINGYMVELADTLALEANAERRAGSSPAIPTNTKKEHLALFFFPYDFIIKII